MRKHVKWLPLILLAFFGSAAVPTNAQSGSGIRANVPFDFIVGDTTFHAGKIVAVRQADGEAGPVSIRNFANGENAFRIARRLLSVDSSDHAKLVFHRYGNRYYLAQVWIPGVKPWELLKSSSERAEMRLAQNSKPELIAVIADTQ